MPRVAIVLFNLGGPDSLETIRPFLFNLFNDPAIISKPRLVRWILAKLISACRARTARSIYDCIGGRSPLVAETEAQARALEAALRSPSLEMKVFPAMRYWHPFISDVAWTVKQWCPDQVVLLPLYPQFSSTTTASSLAEWSRTAAGLEAETTAVCCWPVQPDWVAAVTDLTRQGLEATRRTGVVHDRLPRVLFSAHGLPECVVARGDPYQHQVEETAAAVIAALREPDLDYRVCYQSRIGLQRWIGPETRDMIREAGTSRVPVVLVPVTFVSEHVETLVELDIEYRRVAKVAGVPAYIRVPTTRVHPRFITGLARLVQEALTCEKSDPCSQWSKYNCLSSTFRCTTRAA